MRNPSFKRNIALAALIASLANASPIIRPRLIETAPKIAQQKYRRLPKPMRPRNGACRTPEQRIINRMTNWQRHQWFKACNAGLKNPYNLETLEYFAALPRPNNKAGKAGGA